MPFMSLADPSVGTELVTNFSIWITTMASEARTVMLAVAVGGLGIFAIKWLPGFAKSIFLKMTGR